jgi:hypothetical protein
MTRDPRQIKPINEWLMVLRDENPKAVGSILLTDTLPFAANVGYYSGRVYKIGDKVCSALNVTEEEILNSKVVFRQYLSDVVNFNEKIDDKQVFLLHSKDVEMIVDDSVDIQLF